MNNDFFLHTAIHGEYPKAFVGDPPYEIMGVQTGDGKIMQAPLDWNGINYYNRHLISNAPWSPYTQYSDVMPAIGPITYNGWEVWPWGLYDIVTRISKEYNHPVIEITETVAPTLMGLCRTTPPKCPTRAALSSIAAIWPNSPALSRMAQMCAATMPGACSTITSGPKVTASASGSCMSTSANRSAPSRNQDTGMAA